MENKGRRDGVGEGEGKEDEKAGQGGKEGEKRRRGGGEGGNDKLQETEQPAGVCHKVGGGAGQIIGGEGARGKGRRREVRAEEEMEVSGSMSLRPFKSTRRL